MKKPLVRLDDPVNNTEERLNDDILDELLLDARREVSLDKLGELCDDVSRDRLRVLDVLEEMIDVCDLRESDESVVNVLRAPDHADLLD